MESLVLGVRKIDTLTCLGADWRQRSDQTRLLQPLRCSLQFLFGAQPILLGRTLRPAALSPILLRQTSDLFPRRCGGWCLLLGCRLPFLGSPVGRFCALCSHPCLLY